MKIMICDNDWECIEALGRHCEVFIEERELPITVHGTTCPEDIFCDLPDILILDISMPTISGIEIKNRLAAKEKPLILFATNYPETMTEAFGRNVIGFMTKPVEKKQLYPMLETAVTLLTMDQNLVVDNGTIVNTKDIRNITVKGNYAEIHFLNGTRKSVRKSLKVWEKELVPLGFIRINDSCLLNCRHIQQFNDNEIILLDSSMLRVSRRKREDCFHKYLDYKRRTARYY